ncbi:hypothetical protein EIP75_03725 [Aquabacterium soli]|uniref:Uncharacterized protein n=1 Tax=Aquabacterium soli TaxID=2493092 RepID=A0A3R8U700_9BURK|nr:hypothetical protein EIP75_03725 [Aquabacterium soli]
MDTPVKFGQPWFIRVAELSKAAVIRRTGFPTTKTFRLKPEAEDWGRITEGEMVRGMLQQGSFLPCGPLSGRPASC